MKEKAKNMTNSERAYKTLKEHYTRASVNIRNELYADWKRYAEMKGISIRQLVIESVERAMKEDGFEKSSENVQEK